MVPGLHSGFRGWQALHTFDPEEPGLVVRFIATRVPPALLRVSTEDVSLLVPDDGEGGAFVIAAGVEV